MQPQSKVPSQSLAAAQIAIAGQFKFRLDDLRAYMAEDTIGGYHSDPAQRQWPVGSLWEVEGQLLYALTRLIQPDLVVEIGTHLGCSTTHFARALRQNGKGRIVSCDTASSIDLHGTGTYAVGEMIPTEDRAVVELMRTDGVAFVRDMVGYGGVALIYEDADHSTDTTRQIWTAGSGKLAAGGVLISHDAAHFLVGDAIWMGVLQSGVSGAYRHLIEPSDCGVAIWRAPLDRTFAVRQLNPEAPPAPVANTHAPEDEYDSMTKEELTEELELRDIEHNPKDKKAVLMGLLRADDALEVDA